jgi:hypothetical protein
MIMDIFAFFMRKLPRCYVYHNDVVGDLVRILTLNSI